MKTAIVVATLALSSIVGLSSTVQALPPVDNTVGSGNNSNVEPAEAYTGTRFSCVSQGKGNVATVGQRPSGQPIPVIIWTSQASKYFGDKFTPQQRCQIVTKKLNQAVVNSGGSLKDVVLMTGRVNKNTVICVISANDTGCNGSNALFTLKPENAKKADQVLAQIMQISREGSSAGVVRETEGRVQIKLQDVLKSYSTSQPGKKPAVRDDTRGL
ncbi:MAG: COP23 domain-containing protein [Dolichospermum sp.]